MSFYNKEMSCLLNQAVIYVDRKDDIVKPINNVKMCPLLDLMLNGSTQNIYDCKNVGLCYTYITKNRQQKERFIQK